MLPAGMGIVAGAPTSGGERMEHFVRAYCGIWGVPGCQFFTMTDAIRLVLGTFALACLALWAFGFVHRRR
jgi:hypothetical protein